jgi:transposase
LIAGIDTHKDTLAVAVVDDAGRLIAGGDIPNTERGFVQLVDMFDTHHVLRVGIEGSGNFGRGRGSPGPALAARLAGGGGGGAHLDDLT